MTDEPWPAQRTESEQDAYMAGQRSALKLAREKGVARAERIIELSQRGIIENREQNRGQPSWVENTPTGMRIRVGPDD